MRPPVGSAPLSAEGLCFGVGGDGMLPLALCGGHHGFAARPPMVASPKSH